MLDGDINDISCTIILRRLLSNKLEYKLTFPNLDARVDWFSDIEPPREYRELIYLSICNACQG